MRPGNSYWGNILQSFTTLKKGLGLTFLHLIHIGKKRSLKDRLNIQNPNYFHSQQGIATIQYPHEQLSIPETGRYQLHNEMDDCIVCDKCVKVCPVNCITIDPIRSPDEFGKTSDGTPKRIYAARFDIDMGKCCFCGLCTTVCPTECLTMTPIFNFSSYSMDRHYFKFGNMTVEETEQRKKEWVEYMETRQNAKPTEPTTKPITPKSVFKPKVIVPKTNPPNNE